MTDVLFYGDTLRSAAMRHELPVAIIDPFLLAVVDGRHRRGQRDPDRLPLRSDALTDGAARYPVTPASPTASTTLPFARPAWV